jgi:DNA-binding NarL/FixJ family response regulator
MASEFFKESTLRPTAAKYQERLIMGSLNSSCAILADRNAEASEGIRGLLDSEFDSVYLVTNARTLTEGVTRLAPHLVILDYSIGSEAMPDLLQQVHSISPQSLVIILVLHDHPMLADAMLAAGADAVVLKRAAGTDLFEALAAVEIGKRYVSPAFNLGREASPATSYKVYSS